jgi:hypothetical protein
VVRLRLKQLLWKGGQQSRAALGATLSLPRLVRRLARKTLRGGERVRRLLIWLHQMLIGAKDACNLGREAIEGLRAALSPASGSPLTKLGRRRVFLAPLASSVAAYIAEGRSER